MMISHGSSFGKTTDTNQMDVKKQKNMYNQDKEVHIKNNLANTYPNTILSIHRKAQKQNVSKSEMIKSKLYDLKRKTPRVRRNTSHKEKYQTNQLERIIKEVSHFLPNGENISYEYSVKESNDDDITDVLSYRDVFQESAPSFFFTPPKQFIQTDVSGSQKPIKFNLSPQERQSQVQQRFPSVNRNSKGVLSNDRNIKAIFTLDDKPNDTIIWVSQNSAPTSGYNSELKAIGLKKNENSQDLKRVRDKSLRVRQRSRKRGRKKQKERRKNRRRRPGTGNSKVTLFNQLNA